MAATTTSVSASPSHVPIPSTDPHFVLPSPAGSHQSQSLMDQSESPNDFVFPRRPPSTSNLARPRWSATDASTLLAEIGVLPPPPGPSSGNRLRQPQTPYYQNGARPVSMISTPPMPSVTLSPAPGGRLGHRRGASELIGGDKALELAKKDPGEATPAKIHPQSAGIGPPAHKRGHAHRRSGAISSSDIWGLLSQSAPSLPLAPNQINKENREGRERRGSDGADMNPKPSPVLSWSAPVSPGFVPLSPTAPPVPTLDPNMARKPSRVAFTDQVEIIPRPLSTSSIGSGLTVSTSHQPADSITGVGSLCSPVTKSPTVVSGRSRSNSISSKTSPLSPELLQELSRRPSTAGAILASPGARFKPTEGLPAIRTNVNPIKSIPDSFELPALRKSKHKKALSDSSPRSSPILRDAHAELSENDTSPTASKKSKKGGKRKKKKQIKSWLGAKVLGKHSKNNSRLPSLPKRSPTPPPARSNSVERKSGDDFAPGWTESYVLMPEGSMAGRSLEELSSTMSPRYNSFSSGDSPIIDLDAALAPLNSPTLASGSRAKAFAVAKRTMHSSGAGGKGSIGVGIAAGIGAGPFGAGYIGSHRRSESMPEMPLFTLSENDRMVMDDVFEEEEEYEDETDSDESEDESVNSSSRAEGLGIGIKVVDEEGVTSWEEGLKMDWSVRDQSPSNLSGQVPVRRGSLAPSLSKGSLRSESIMEEEEPEETIVESRRQTSATTTEGGQKGNESPSSTTSCVTPTSPVASAQLSTSTVTPITATPSSPRLAPSTSSASIAYSTTTESPISAPSTPHLGPSSPSTNPYATPTIKELAAQAALEDDGFDPYADSPLHFLGEPGPEMRMSVDDVPSLTSSSSTMTSSYAAYCLAAQPSTPRIAEDPANTMNKKSKSGKRKWSRMLKFWDAKKGKS